MKVRSTVARCTMLELLAFVGVWEGPGGVLILPSSDHFSFPHTKSPFVVLTFGTIGPNCCAKISATYRPTHRSLDANPF
jgi:hypothetical protein